MNRRTFLAASCSPFVVYTAGCMNEEPKENSGENECPDEWGVIISNLSEQMKDLSVKITDNDDTVLFSDTLELEPHEDTFDGVKVNTKIYHGNKYTFEASLSKNNTLVTEEVVDCGNAL